MRRRSRLVCAGLLVLGLAIGVRTSVEAQRSKIPATLLKRVAEAVDGHRTGRPVWVVIEWHFPFTVLGVYEVEAQADSNVAGVGSDDAGKFGPYDTEGDGEGGYGKLFAVQGATPKKANSDTSHSLSGMIALPVERVAEVLILVRTRDGKRFETRLDPGDLDAVFFTTASIDKLLIPYYERILGVDAAAEMRRHYIMAYRAAAINSR